MSRDPIKREDSVKLPDGSIHEITSIQYAHNRYQLLRVSGWQYGIQNLELMKPKSAYIYWFDQAKTLKEDNVRWTCEYTGAEQKYLTQSNTLAELRGRAERAEERERKLKELMEWIMPYVPQHVRVTYGLETLYPLDREDIPTISQEKLIEYGFAEEDTTNETDPM